MKLALALALLALIFVASPGSARAQAGPAPDDSRNCRSGPAAVTASTAAPPTPECGTSACDMVGCSPIPPGPGRSKGDSNTPSMSSPYFSWCKPAKHAYGFGLNPFALKWNFVPRHNVMPYIDIGGGTLFTNEQVPPGTSHVNFTTSGAIGAHFLRSKYNWSAEIRFMHISNAGLITPNPGINTLQFRIGFGRFTQPK